MATFRTMSAPGTYPREIRTYPKVQASYGYDVDPETGKRIVVKKGSSNVYLQKQEAYPETRLYNLIDRVNRTGDMSLLGEAVEGYFDATTLPRDLMQAEQLRLRSESLFNSLPLEERRKYNNDIGIFLKHVNITLKENAVKQAAAKRAEAVKEETQNNG